MALFAEEDRPAMEINVPEARPESAVRLDGGGLDPLWARARTLPPLRRKDGSGEPPERATRVRVLRAGTWLLFALEAKEPESIVAREGMHGAALWYDDAFHLSLKGPRTLEVMVNPFGTLWTNTDGGRAEREPITLRHVRAAARITRAKWRVELAVDLRSLAKPGSDFSKLELEVMRQRQQRGLAPYEEPRRSGLVLRLGEAWSGARGARAVRLDVAPPQRFGGRRLLKAGRCRSAPRNAAEWAKLPATRLRPEDGKAPLREYFQPTVLRAALTDDALVLRALCQEAHPEAMADQGPELWTQDDLEVFLGPVGYGYLQVAANPRGRLSAARGKTGGRRVRAMAVPQGVEVRARKGSASWSLRFTIPLAVILREVGAPPDLHPEVYPWRVQVIRNRPARAALGQEAQASVLAVTHSSTSHCPLRFAIVRAVAPASRALALPAPPKPDLPPPVLNAKQRKERHASGLLRRWVAARKARRYEASEAAFAKITDGRAWKAYAERIRAHLRQAVFPATDGRPPKRGGLHPEIVYDHEGEGFHVQGLIFEAQRGEPVPATLYLPKGRPDKKHKRPALILIPAHHTPRNSPDLYTAGANFARAGGVALATESVGSGERSVTALWEHKNYQRNLAGTQLTLAGEELAGWTAFDISRATDYLLKRGDIDPRRVGIVGGVAGGGDLSALAAALDERLTLSVPFNFSSLGPMDSWYDPLRSYPGALAGGYSAWTVNALIAPRRLIQAQEFTWSKTCQKRYARYQKVYGWLKAAKNLAFLHGGPQTHATHFNYMHRLPLYKILNRWWGLALPEKRKDEYVYRVPSSQMECFGTAKGRRYLDRLRKKGRLREPHERAAGHARKSRYARRKERKGNAGALRKDLDRLLGETRPCPIPAGRRKPLVQARWREHYPVEGYWLPAEPEARLGLALWLFSPPLREGAEAAPRPVVLGIAQAGKARFLAERSGQVERLLKAGVAVALLDFRGSGETSPGPVRFPEGPSASLAFTLWQLHDSLPARRVKDVRTALAFLAARKDLAAGRIALWGEGFTEPNGAAGQPFLFEETGFRQSSPMPKRLVEPSGAWVALLAALYPIRAGARTVYPRALLLRGGLASFASVLAQRHYYVPADAILPGLLRTADVLDLVEALQGKRITVEAEDLRDGENRSLDAAQLRAAWGPAAPAAYRPYPAMETIEALARRLLE